MTVSFVPDQNFDCGCCTRCCRAFKVALDAPAYEKIKGSRLELRVVQETGRPSLTLTESGFHALEKREDGSCIFLQSDHLCGVHAELGADAKPLTCLQFPFLFQATPEGVSVGVSFFCPSVQKNEGRALEQHAQEIGSLLQVLRPTPPPLLWVQGEECSWERCRALRDSLLAELATAERGREVMRNRFFAELAARGLEHKPIWDWMEQQFTVALLDRAQSMAGELVELFHSEQKLRFPQLGWEGPAATLEQWRQSADLQEYYRQEKRYLRQFLERDGLASASPVLETLMLLFLVPGVTLILALVSAHQGGRPSPSTDDCFYGLETAEADILTHSKEGYLLSGNFLRFFLSAEGGG